MYSYQYNSTDNYYHPGTMNNFAYKDSGDAESRIYRIIQNAKNKSIFSGEIVNQATDWPSFYHLTPLRANILRPFVQEISTGSTLELGAGCGAITRFLGELGGKVVAIEGSHERARIIGKRCEDLTNVTVITDLIQNFTTEEKFDVVTLIGVLEYSQVYIDEPDPIQYLLNLAKSFLKQNGLLIVAIENQLGLKYFCGSAEDHLGRPMFGINDSYTSKSVITFGRKELTQRIRKAGFNAIDLYVPLPDYKTPVSIIYPSGFEDSSAAAGWDVSPILAGAVVYDRQSPGVPSFSLECAWGVIGRNGLAQDFANSFLFAARINETDTKDNVLAAHYGYQRAAQFAKETQFTLEDGTITAKTRLVSNTSALHTAAWDQHPYLQGKSWFDELQLIVNRPEWQFSDLYQWASIWLDALCSVPFQDASETISELRHFSRLLPANYIDATPTNFIVNDSEKGDFFDLEWNFSIALPVEFVALRGLFITLHRITSCARPASDVPVKLFDLTIAIMQKYGLTIKPEDLELFVALFNAFQNKTQGIDDSNLINGLTALLDTATLPIRKLFT